MLKHYKIKTKYNDVYDITKEVRQAVEESGVEEGICIVYNPHSTAGITVFSPRDQDEIRRLVPTRVDFKHQHDTPQDAAGHVKSALLGISNSFIVHEGNLLLGGSQGIYFLEFDGPRDREYFVKVFSDK